ncbi:MAG: BspA family leucine-rich repeat surface protein [Flexilinea sp.]|nr:BspA family leucine-rich repeat surface protein [Flexilinea sp.]
MDIRKKHLFISLWLIIFAFTFGGVTAADDSGTCGTNVKFTISGNTISFAKGDGAEAPKWEDGEGSNCGAVFREDREITSVKVTEKISVTNGNQLFYDFRYVREMDLSKLDVSAVTDMSYMFLGCGSLESLDLSGWDTSSVTNMIYMFRECGCLESLDLSGWDTSKVTNMSGMFLECGSLSSVDVSGWNTSGVEGMANMFDGCSYLESLDVSGWDTSSVISMRGMFLGCGSLSSVDVSGWNTSGVKGMTNMFGGCGSLSSVDVSGWDTSSVTDMNSMFYDCGSLSSLDVSGWDTSFVTDMHYMFWGCESLKSLDISGWNTSSVTDMDQMFLACYSLQTLALGKNTVSKNIFENLPAYNNSTWYYLKTGAAAGNPLPPKTGKAGSELFGAYDSDKMAGVWSKNQDLVLAADITIEYPAGTVITGETVPVHSTEVQLTASASPDGAGQKFFWHSSNPKTAVVDADGNVTFKKYGTAVITVKAADGSGVSAQTTLSLTGTCGTNVKYTVDGSTISFAKGDGTEDPKWEDGAGSNCGAVFKDDPAITSVKVTGKISVTNGKELFRNFGHVREMDLSELDVSAVTDMAYMFRDCGSLKSLDLSGWDTSSVTGMYDMFYHCYDLESLDVSGWDTSSVTGMDDMFYECGSLKSLDLSGWDTSSVTDMSFMFYKCSFLTNLDVSGWDTSSVTSMDSMFKYCSSLESLDVSGWDTSSVVVMNYMFQLCSSLESLDVSGWDTSKVREMDGMFSGCSSLTSLDLSGWDTSSVTSMDSMFYNCSSLKTLVLGKNTLRTNIFGRLPAYNSPWYYLKTGAAAGNPLPPKTGKAGSELFGAYDSDKMAGVWSTDPDLVLAESIRIEYPAGTDVTDLTVPVDRAEVQLTATASPDGAGKKFFWHSGDPKTASVDGNGNVTFKKAGKVTITVKAADCSGASAETALTYGLAESVKILGPDGKDITGGTVTVDTEAYQLKAKALPESVPQEFTWKSSDTDTASVSKAGKVTFKKAGTVTITAAAADGSEKSAEVTLTLKAEDPAEITAEAEVIRGGNAIDLDDFVTKAIGKVSFSIKGEDLGCSLNSDSHVLTSGEKTGKVTVAVSVADSGFHYGKTGTVTVSVIEKKQGKLEVEQKGAVFGGTLPAPEYSAPAGTVSETVLYSGAGCGPSEEPPSEPGSYTVTVSCETKDTVYTGTAEFTIAPKPLSDPSVTAKLLPSDSFTRTGETFRITGAEVRDGDKLLTEGVDYEITAESVLSAVEVGTYEVTVSADDKAAADTDGTAAKTVTGRDYSGSVTLTWQIKPGDTPGPERPGIDFFRLHGDCELPATGFSALRPTVLPEQPKELRYTSLRMRLMLPTLDQDIELVTVPRDGNSWAVAWLGTDAGILEGSALPGEGVSLIAGHNTLNDTDYGPFALLSTLEVNDTVMVREESGALKLFRVYANELLEPDDMERLSALAGDDALVLLTCENESAAGGYLNRRVVFAKEIQK